MNENLFGRNNINDEEDDGYEFWEYDYRLLESKDYEELIRYREYYLEKHPCDEHAKWRLGEAYILNGEYERALKYFTLMYQESFENGDVVYSILDALFALGKDENDFEWIEKPTVIRSFEAAEICYKLLRRKRKPVSIGGLHSDLMIKGYLSFSELELYNELVSDERFEILDNGNVYTSTVKVIKKNQKKKK